MTAMGKEAEQHFRQDAQLGGCWAELLFTWQQTAT